MVKFLYSVFLSLLFIGCCKESETESIPVCVVDLWNEVRNGESPGARIMHYKEKNLYWIQTGAVMWDGAEYIYDASCNEVCLYCGFCLIPECQDDLPEYNSEKWVLLIE